MSEGTNSGSTPELPLAVQLVLCFGALVGLLCAMYESVVYPWPGGPLGISGFIALWLKEVFLVACIAVGLLALLLLWLGRLVRRIGTLLSQRDAPK